jgi:hypothetical protein
MFLKNAKKVFKIKNIAVMMIVLSIVLSGGIYKRVIDTVTYSFVAGKRLDDPDSLSSQRYSRIKYGLRNLKENPLFGYRSLDMSRSHCSFLGYLIDLGVLGSWPLLLIYFAIPILLVFYKGIPISKFGREIIDIRYPFFVAYIVSLFEVNAPYGPGIVFFFIWFILAQFIRNKKTLGDAKVSRMKPAFSYRSNHIEYGRM